MSEAPSNICYIFMIHSVKKRILFYAAEGNPYGAFKVLQFPSVVLKAQLKNVSYITVNQMTVDPTDSQHQPLQLYAAGPTKAIFI